jgi:LytS/YehU family sensor histidine kinase
MKWSPLSTVSGLSELPLPFCCCFAFIYDGESVNFYEDLSPLFLLFKIIFWIVSAGIICYYSFHFINKKKKIRAQKQAAEKIDDAKVLSKLSHLRHQMNPHFLFNSLSILRATAKEEWVKNFAVRLSDLYRYILDHSLKSDMVSLNEEMEIVYAYLEILKSSHGKNYKITIMLTDEAMKSKVLPLSIQGLIENAFKHNIVTSELPLQLSVFLEKGHVVICNNINRKKYDSAQHRRQGTGLKNLNERYQIIANKKIQIIEGLHSFVVKIPLL